MKFEDKESTHWKQNREKLASMERIQNTKRIEEKFTVIPGHSICSDWDSETQHKNAACCANFSPLNSSLMD